MTTHKNITRILAVLLAVLLFGQLAAFQIPAFAADVVPDVHDGAAYIPDDADVNDLLSQTLLSNYSDRTRIEPSGPIALRPFEAIVCRLPPDAAPQTATL